ncbi:hypothetical protein KLP40_03260 [Hymenobacter sp. NST-14]|uniref:hypothetical protein n=1 Tax=Hymenobacter piscis TaxID=2839984 RepID=UPI001C02FC1E|nr:hypothetical protein [Hymenobacter piscis]MBT9392170.1 hypothetical protein [Hymenobacter piscis]
MEHLNAMHDGDVVAHIVRRTVTPYVLDDPFGLSALLDGLHYNGPNRFFAHGALFAYMRNMPLFLQHFVDPVYSTYMASAVAKTLMQGGLIILLAYYISRTSRLNAPTFLLAALLVTPFFQTAGYMFQMAVIDYSITYCFFYALPQVLLLFYYLPLHRALFVRPDTALGWGWQVALPVLAVVLALSGPLIPAEGVLISAALLLYTAATQRQQMRAGGQLGTLVRLPAQLLRGPLRGVILQLSFFIICCLYSLYIGTFNSENNHDFTVWEMYEKLWNGIPLEFTSQIGFPVLLAAVLVNLLLLKASAPTPASARLLRIAQWFFLLGIIYIVLLPLGGYRNYRPNIVRRDTLIPITLALMYLYGSSTVYLLRHGPPRFNRLYIPALVAIVALYSFADVSDLRQDNCERDALRTIARSKEAVVHLESDCPVLNWGPITDPNVSGDAARAMYLWRITQEEKPFYH